MDPKIDTKVPKKTRPADPFPMIASFTLEASEAIESGKPKTALNILSLLNKMAYCYAKDGWWDKLEP